MSPPGAAGRTGLSGAPRSVGELFQAQWTRACYTSLHGSWLQPFEGPPPPAAGEVQPGLSLCFCPSPLYQDIQQLLQLQQLVLVPGHHLQPPAQFLLPQAQQSQPGETSAQLTSSPDCFPCSTTRSCPPPRPLTFCVNCLPRAATNAKSIPATSANPGSSPDLPAPGWASYTGETVHCVYQATGRSVNKG